MGFIQLWRDAVAWGLLPLASERFATAHHVAVAALPNSFVAQCVVAIVIFGHLISDCLLTVIHSDSVARWHAIDDTVLGACISWHPCKGSIRVTMHNKLSDYCYYRCHIVIIMASVLRLRQTYCQWLWLWLMLITWCRYADTRCICFFPSSSIVASTTRSA